MERNDGRFLVIGNNIVLKSGPSGSIGAFFFVFLLLLKVLIIDTAEVVVVKLDMFEFGAKDVHFGAVFKDDFIVEVDEGFFCLSASFVLDKGFPYFRLFEDENFDYSAVGAKELIQVVMSDDVAELIVDADQQHGPFFLSSTHI